MAYNNLPVRDKSKGAYFITESTPGTIVLPSDSDTSFLLCEELSGISQEPKKASITEYSSEILQNDEVITGYDFASPGVNINARLGASAGTAPPEATLLTSFFGTETIVSSTSVTYTFLNQVNTLSAWLLTENKFLDCAAGFILGQLGIEFNADDVLKYKFQGQSNRIYRSGVSVVPTGTADVTAGSDAVITTSADPADSQFFVGQQVAVYNGDSLVEVVTVKTVSDSAATFTADTTQTISEDFELRPAMPTARSISTKPFKSKTATVYIGAANAVDGYTSSDLFYSTNSFVVTELSLDLNRNLTTPEAGALNGLEYPEAAYLIGDKVEISGSLGMLKKPVDFARLNALTTTGYVSLGIQIPVGSRKIEVYIPEISLVRTDGQVTEGAASETMSFTQTSGTAQTDATRFKLRYL